MQWLAMIMTFLFGRRSHKGPSLKEVAVEIFDEVTVRSRKIVTLTLTGFGAVIFFCGGFFISLLETTSQYDRVGYVTFSATLSAGMGLMILAVFTFAGVFGRGWPQRTTHAHAPPKEEPAPQPSALESAFSALIMDYVKERQLRREAKIHNEEESHRPEPPSPSAFH